MLRGGLTKNWSEMMELSKMLVFTMKNIVPSVPDYEVKTHVPSHSGPETDRGEATKAKPRMRRDMALDGFFGAPSHTETDRGLQQKRTKPRMRPWPQIAPLTHPLAWKQIVGNIVATL